MIYDLRYFAGCRRLPRPVRRAVRWGGGCLHGHFGTDAAQWRAAEIEGGFRSGLRHFAREAVKAHRAGADLEALLEPEARTRHGALWDTA